MREIFLSSGCDSFWFFGFALFLDEDYKSRRCAAARDARQLFTARSQKKPLAHVWELCLVRNTHAHTPTHTPTRTSLSRIVSVSTPFYPLCCKLQNLKSQRSVAQQLHTIRVQVCAGSLRLAETPECNKPHLQLAVTQNTLQSKADTRVTSFFFFYPPL